MGRPTKLAIDPELAEKIIRFVRVGNFKETAAAAAGVDPRTLRRWMTDGARGIEPYADFARKLEQASAESECVDVARISAAGKKHWDSIGWRLERKSPKNWGFRVRVNVAQELDGFLKALKERLSKDVFEQVLRAAADAAREGALGDASEDAGDET